MKSLKERKKYIILLVFILLPCLILNLAEDILFWKLCTEQDRNIPPNAEVLVSACKRPIVRGVPGGETLFVHEVKTGKIYLLDLLTGKKRKIPQDPLLLSKGIFLSSELVWLEGSGSKPGSPSYNADYILDLNDGKRYELLNLGLLPRLEYGIFDPKNYAYIQASDLVYIHHSENTLVALSSDFRTNQNGRVFLTLYSNSSENGEVLEQQMEDLGVDYEIVDYTLYDTEVPSPTQKYIARFEGIYLAETDPPTLIRDGAFNYFKGWYYDDSGIIVQDGGYYLMTLPGISTIYYVPSPVIKLLLTMQ